MSAPPTFDLQCHSSCSDGALAPAEVVAAAAAAGVELLALTDHDTVDGVQEALAAADAHGIALVAAVEISAADALGEDLHVLGYCVEHTDAQLQRRLVAWREDRARRIERMAEGLAELGLAPDRAQLEQLRAAGRPLGRPHLAAAAIAANRERLAREGLDEPSAFLEAHLVPGAPAYSRRTTPTVTQAIDAVHAAGGLAVWAHPFWDLDDEQECVDTIRRFADAGLDGVEVFYPTHDEGQTTLLHRTCTELGLLITGSSDFHGPEHDRFNRFGAFDTFGLEPNLGPIGSGV